FLHPAKVNDDLFKSMAADVAVGDTHVLRDDLLKRAMDAGVFTPELQEETERALLELVDKADAVLLTCSTLGPAADALNMPSVLRVDRALAKQAVADGGDVAVLVAVETTIGPTRELFEEEAVKTGATIRMVMVEGAWEKFLAGDMQAYAQAIADCASTRPEPVVALAQASMAPATELVEEKLVLASPRAGLDAVLDYLGEAG
ncbi:MAG: Asp/Glu racemase, partial [Hyphomicrobiales bacterium]